MNITEKQLEAIIERAVIKAFEKRDRICGVRWLSKRELIKQFGMISDDWLKHYGWKLPRERIDFTGDDGEKHSTQWGYNADEIQRMFEDGEMRDL